MPLVIMEKQIKTTLRCHSTPVRMAKINKSKSKFMLASMGNTYTLLVGVQTCVGIVEISVVIPEKAEK